MPCGEKRTERNGRWGGGGLGWFGVGGKPGLVTGVVAAVLVVKYEDMERGMDDAERTERREKTPGDVGVGGDSSPGLKCVLDEEKSRCKLVYDLRGLGEVGGVQMGLPGIVDG